jgi:hypothetical protein
MKTMHEYNTLCDHSRETLMKKNEMSFLDKFEGKTSKMGKQGITALLLHSN